MSRSVHSALRPVCAIAAALMLMSPAPAAQFHEDELAAVMHRMHAAMAAQPSGDFDLDFSRMMIAHHQGAIDMAKLQLLQGKDQRLRRLAQNIIVEQHQEILVMRTILNPLEARSSGDPAGGQDQHRVERQ